MRDAPRARRRGLRDHDPVLVVARPPALPGGVLHVRPGDAGRLRLVLGQLQIHAGHVGHDPAPGRGPEPRCVLGCPQEGADMTASGGQRVALPRISSPTRTFARRLSTAPLWTRYHPWSAGPRRCRPLRPAGGVDGVGAAVRRPAAVPAPASSGSATIRRPGCTTTGGASPSSGLAAALVGLMALLAHSRLESLWPPGDNVRGGGADPRPGGGRRSSSRPSTASGARPPAGRWPSSCGRSPPSCPARRSERRWFAAWR